MTETTRYGLLELDGPLKGVVGRGELPLNAAGGVPRHWVIASEKSGENCQLFCTVSLIVTSEVLHQAWPIAVATWLLLLLV